MSSRTVLRAVLADLADVVVPVACPGCGLGGTAVCPACAAPLRAPPVVCDPPAWPTRHGPAVACAAYAGAASRLVVAWKDRGRLDLTGLLADALAASLARALAGTPPGVAPVLLVPMPSSRAAVRRRGEDVVALLARAAADRLRRLPGAPGVRVVPGLVQRRGVADQAGLTARQRRDNTAGRLRPALLAAPLLRGARVVLVDDVVTTGASAASAVRALDGTGAKVLALATVCATPGRTSPAPRPCALSGSQDVV